MKRSFVIPAAIALALHAMLFIGSSKPPETTKITQKKTPIDKVVDLVKQIEVELQKLEVPEANVSTEEKSGGGGGERSPVGIPEIPRFASPGPFEITQEQVRVDPGDGSKLPTGFTGPGNGTGNGYGPDIVGALSLDNPPATRSQREPVYPHGMKSAGITGTVWVEFTVDVGGRVHDVQVVKSTHKGFEEATVAAVSSWRFEPGKRKGIPVRFRMTIPIVFSLSD